MGQYDQVLSEDFLKKNQMAVRLIIIGYWQTKLKLDCIQIIKNKNEQLSSQIQY